MNYIINGIYTLQKSILPGILISSRDYPKFCVNLQCSASILHHIGGLHKIWDSLVWLRRSTNSLLVKIMQTISE